MKEFLKEYMSGMVILIGWYFMVIGMLIIIC